MVELPRLKKRREKAGLQEGQTEATAVGQGVRPSLRLYKFLLPSSLPLQSVHLSVFVLMVTLAW